MLHVMLWEINKANLFSLWVTFTSVIVIRVHLEYCIWFWLFPNPCKTQTKLSASFCKAEEREKVANYAAFTFWSFHSFFPWRSKKKVNYLNFLFPHLLEIINCYVFHQCLKLDHCISICKTEFHTWTQIQ